MDDLKNTLDSFGVKCNDSQIEQFTTFTDSLLEYNVQLNLVSKTNPGKEIFKQIIDSSVVTQFDDLVVRGTLLDIGSGGGFPGMVIKIIRPEINLISLDSSPRKITFQRETATKLGLSNCEFVDLQLSEYHPEIEFDYITAKAFGKFKKILSFGRNYLKDTGRLILYLGENTPDEINDPKNTAFTIDAEYPYKLPGSDTKSRIFVLKKSA